MTRVRPLAVAAVVLVAVLLQPAVVARLPLPGAPPDLVLCVVVAVALAGGPLAGMLSGFGAGLLADLTADHELGRLALAYLLGGVLAGRLADEPPRSPAVRVLVVVSAAAGALAVHAVEGLLLDDPRAGLAAVRQGLTSSVLYSGALAPGVVPGVARLVRRPGRTTD